MVFILSAVLLLQQRHPLSLGIPTATGHAGARDVGVSAPYLLGPSTGTAINYGSQIPILHQRHPFSLGIPAATDDAVQVYAAGRRIRKRWHLALLYDSTLVLARESVLCHT